MAKQPLANQPVPGFAGHSGQKQLFLFIFVGLALLALLALGLSQEPTTTHAQTTNGAINFGNQQVNTTSGAKAATYTNNSTVTQTVSASLTGSPDFSGSNSTCGAVAPGASCSIDVKFTPTSPGLKNGIVRFNYQFNNSIGLSPPALVNGSSSVGLQGNGVNPPTQAGPSCGSQIQGYVVVDGQPGVGQVVKLEGPFNDQATIGPGGFFYFNNLCAGTYKLSVIYDHAKYTPNTPDSVTIKTDGINSYRDNAFGLVTIQQTTVAPTSAAPTSAAPTSAAATTPAVTTVAAASCPASLFAAPSGTKLRVGGQIMPVNANSSKLCLQVSAGDVLVDLNDTVIINLPAGAIVTQASANLGTVTTSSNTVRWGGFSLNPKQSANLVLSIDSPAGNLNSGSLFVSGSFNRSQAFQQRIPGLSGLVDISPPAAPANQSTGSRPSTGGQGGGSPVVPSAAPVTGAGAENNQQGPLYILALAVITSTCLGLVGLFLTVRANKRPDQKEQK